MYRVRINYRRISLRHNLSRKCCKIVKFVSITHSERNIWNGPIVATAISREKRKPVLEGNGFFAKSSDNSYAPCSMNTASYKELYRADASKSAMQYHRCPEGVLRVSFSGAHIIISEVTPRSP